MNLLLILIIAGVVMALLPMDARIKQLIYVVLVVLLIVWLFQVFGGGSLRIY
jgi:hypothetical protein